MDGSQDRVVIRNRSSSQRLMSSLTQTSFFAPSATHNSRVTSMTVERVNESRRFSLCTVVRCIAFVSGRSKQANMSDEWISIQIHISLPCCMQWCRKIAQQRLFRRTFTFIATRSHFQRALFFHSVNVEFIFGWFNSCENSARLLFWIFLLCSLAWRRLQSAALRLIAIPISTSAIMDTERQVLHLMTILARRNWNLMKLTRNPSCPSSQDFSSTTTVTCSVSSESARPYLSFGFDKLWLLELSTVIVWFHWEWSSEVRRNSLFRTWIAFSIAISVKSTVAKFNFSWLCGSAITTRLN